MKLKLMLMAMLLSVTTSLYANECDTKVKTICQEDGKQVWIDSGHQYTCEWIPDNTYPTFGICILVKVNPPKENQ